MWKTFSDEQIRLNKIETRLDRIEQVLNGFNNLEKTCHYFGLKAQVRALLHHFKLFAPPAEIPSFDDFSVPELKKCPDEGKET